MATTDHFRLLDLPLELQRKIFKAYFGNWSVEVTRHHNEDHTACYNPFDGPSFLAVLVANRHIHLEAKPVLWSTFDRTLYIGGLKLDDDHSVMQKLRSISPEIETLELEHRTALSALEAARGFDFSKLRLVEFLNDVQDGFLFSRRHDNVGFVGLLNGQLGEQFAEQMFFETEVCHYGSLLSDMAFVKDDRNRNVVYRAVFLLDILRQWRGEANHYSLPADLMRINLDLTLHPSNRSVTITSLSVIESTTFVESGLAGEMTTRAPLPSSIVLDSDGTLVNATHPWRTDLPPRTVSED